MLLKFANRTIKIQAVSLVLSLAFCLVILVFGFTIFESIIMLFGGLYSNGLPWSPETEPKTNTFAGIPFTLIGASLLPVSLVSFILVLWLFGYIWKRLWKGVSQSEMIMHICLLLGNLGFLMGGSR